MNIHLYNSKGGLSHSIMLGVDMVLTLGWKRCIVGDQMNKQIVKVKGNVNGENWKEAPKNHVMQNKL